MTLDEKKAWLNRYSEADREIDRITESIQRWYSRAMKVTPSISLTPGGGDGVPIMVKAVERIEGLQSKLLGKMEEQEAIKAEIEEAINGVDNQNQRQVLKYRYLDRMKFENIAVTMVMNYRWILRLHVNGLDKLAIESHIPDVV